MLDRLLQDQPEEKKTCSNFFAFFKSPKLRDRFSFIGLASSSVENLLSQCATRMTTFANILDKIPYQVIGVAYLLPFIANMTPSVIDSCRGIKPQPNKKDILLAERQKQLREYGVKLKKQSLMDIRKKHLEEEQKKKLEAQQQFSEQQLERKNEFYEVKMSEPNGINLEEEPSEEELKKINELLETDPELNSYLNKVAQTQKKQKYENFEFLIDFLLSTLWCVKGATTLMQGSKVTDEKTADNIVGWMELVVTSMDTVYLFTKVLLLRHKRKPATHERDQLKRTISRRGFFDEEKSGMVDVIPSPPSTPAAVRSGEIVIGRNSLNRAIPPTVHCTTYPASKRSSPGMRRHLNPSD